MYRIFIPLFFGSPLKFVFQMNQQKPPQIFPLGFSHLAFGQAKSLLDIKVDEKVPFDLISPVNHWSLIESVGTEFRGFTVNSLVIYSQFAGFSHRKLVAFQIPADIPFGGTYHQNQQA